MRKSHTVNPNTFFTRLDKYLLHLYPDIQRSSLLALIRKKEVRVNDAVVRDPSYPLRLGDEVSVFLPESTPKWERIQRNTQGKRKLQPREMDLHILYEDDEMLVINKPPGISVHPGKGERNRSTLIEGLLFFGQSKGFEPFLVHRLDRQTSGLLVVAKDRFQSRHLSRVFRERLVQKWYWVMVAGSPPYHQTINEPIEGKEAETHLVAKRSFDTPFGTLSLCEVGMATGRKHQIRLHLSSKGWPILADDQYGDFGLNRALKRVGLQRTFLHCSRMSWIHTDQRAFSLDAPLWEDLQAFLDRCDQHAFS